VEVRLTADFQGRAAVSIRAILWRKMKLSNFRDGDKTKDTGKKVFLKAVENVNNILSREVIGRVLLTQEGVDKINA
jgi:enolase